jgi:hypothetical protein
MKESLARVKAESFIQQGCGLVDLTPPCKRPEELVPDRAHVVTRFGKRTEIGNRR